GNFVARLAGGEPPVSYEELRELDPDEQVPTFVARMREVGFLPPGSGEGGLRRLLRVYKTNVVASRSYGPLPYGGPITLLRAAAGVAEDAAGASGSEERQEAIRDRAEDPTLGWSRFASLPVEVQTLPGDHLTIFGPENLEELAERLRLCLAGGKKTPE
ncbi:MAG: hypothetical protein GY856_50610, partial [bacterium]|nr:hypothetical protein [bacterium]